MEGTKRLVVDLPVSMFDDLDNAITDLKRSGKSTTKKEVVETLLKGWLKKHESKS